MEWRAKHLVSAQALTPVAGGLYEGQLVVWDAVDAHNDVFTRQTKFHIYGEPPVYLDHNYFAPPVGRIVHFSEREDGLYVALKLERPLEDVSGIHLSVGGFAIGEVRNDGAYEIKEFALFEASLTPTPAQPNSELVLLMKTLNDMAIQNGKATPANTGIQATQQVAPQSITPWDTGNQVAQQMAPQPNTLSYLQKQGLTQQVAPQPNATWGVGAQASQQVAPQPNATWNTGSQAPLPAPPQPAAQYPTAPQPAAQYPTAPQPANPQPANPQLSAPQPSMSWNTGSQTPRQVTPQPSALGYLRKQDLAQLEAIVTELMARMEALEMLPVQLAELQRRVAELEAAVSQIQGLTQEAVTQSVKKAMEVVAEQVQPIAKEMAKTMLLVAEALKKTNAQKI